MCTEKKRVPATLFERLAYFDPSMNIQQFGTLRRCLVRSAGALAVALALSADYSPPPYDCPTPSAAFHPSEVYGTDTSALTQTQEIDTIAARLEAAVKPQSVEELKTALSNGDNVLLVENETGFAEMTAFLQSLTNDSALAQFKPALQPGEVATLEVSSYPDSTEYGSIENKIVGIIIDLDCFSKTSIHTQAPAIQTWVNAREMTAVQGSTVFVQRTDSSETEVHFVTTFIPLNPENFDTAAQRLQGGTFEEDRHHGAFTLISAAEAVPLSEPADVTFICTAETLSKETYAFLHNVAEQKPKAMVINRSLSMDADLMEIYEAMIQKISTDFPDVTIVFVQSYGNNGKEYHFYTNGLIVYVSSIDQNNYLYTYSNHNIPGTDTTSTIGAPAGYEVAIWNGQKTTYNGTSSASPKLTSATILALQNMSPELFANIQGKSSEVVINSVLDYIEATGLRRMTVDTLEFPVLTSAEIITTTSSLSLEQAQAMSPYLTGYSPTIDGKVTSVEITLYGQVSLRDAYPIWGIDYQNISHGKIESRTRENTILGWLSTNQDAKLIYTAENLQSSRKIYIPTISGIPSEPRGQVLQGLQQFYEQLPQIQITLPGGEIATVSFRALTRGADPWAPLSAFLPFIQH